MRDAANWLMGILLWIVLLPVYLFLGVYALVTGKCIGLDGPTVTAPRK